MDIFTAITIVSIILLVRTFFKRISKSIGEENEKAKNKTLARAKLIIQKDLVQLSIQRKQLVTVDTFGKEDLNKWINKGVLPYLNNNLKPKLPDSDHRFFQELDRALFDIIQKKTEKYLSTSNSSTAFRENFTGQEFEIYCEDELKKNNWKVSRTKISGDQGVDLIAEKGGRKLAIQCKRCARPVGNKAVQEIVAGLNFYLIKEGIIISNNSYTPAARALAQANNIRLMNYLEINTL